MYGDMKSKFAKRFEQVGDIMKQAFQTYIKEVQDGVFPAQEHCFAIDEEVLKCVEDK